MYAPDTAPNTAPNNATQRIHVQRGVSIVEVMVGMVVALLVGLAATGSAQMFTASQRQGIGTGGALLNATTALTALRDDVAAAGLGFFGDSKYLCSKLNLSVAASVVQDGAAFTPVAITAEAAGDRIDVVSSTQVAAGVNVLLKTSTTGMGNTTAELRSLLPVTAGQAVLLAPATQGSPCLVRSVTAVADATDDTPQTLTFGSSGANSTYNQASFATNPTYPVNDYPDIGRVTLLGDVRWSRYRLQGTELRLERPMGGSAVVLVRNVVAFKAQYGMANAAAGSTALETWENAVGGFVTMTAANLPRVRALQIGVVTRSPQAEKANPATGVCEATPTMPTLFGNAVTSDVTDWQCYRYRTAIVVVPLRNLVIGMTP